VLGPRAGVITGAPVALDRDVIEVEPAAGDHICPRSVVHVETIGRSPSGKFDHPRLGVRSMDSWPISERKTGSCRRATDCSPTKSSIACVSAPN
jgi:hypothetical protein